MTEFSGFGAPTIRFLEGLSGNNDKSWFEEHRDEYEASYIAPAKAFIADIGERLREVVPGINADPKINGSIFRINRDIRFAKDKTPYKDHLDLWFWEGERKSAASGLFFRLTKDALILGAGAHGFAPAQLSAYRDALQNAAKSERLLSIEDSLGKSGVNLNGEHYKTVPRGMSLDDPRLERLSRFNALYALFDSAHPSNLSRPDFMDHCLDRWKVLAPLHAWLIAMGRGPAATA